MSTIASPRDPTTSFRRTNSSQAVGTPTSSARPSLDIPRSTTSSPNPGSGPIPPTNKRSNRAALREYYNLKKTPAAATPPLLEVTDTDSVGDAAETSYSEVPLSDIDADGFDADAYIRLKLKDSSLEELLKTYTRVLGEIRALDAEKKALVYDNYSKLITATETIRKVGYCPFPLFTRSWCDGLLLMLGATDAGKHGSPEPHGLYIRPSYCPDLFPSLVYPGSLAAVGTQTGGEQNYGWRLGKKEADRGTRQRGTRCSGKGTCTNARGQGQRSGRGLEAAEKIAP